MAKGRSDSIIKTRLQVASPINMSCLPNPLRALVCFVCLSLMAAHGHAKKVEREPLDLGILEESAELAPFMTNTQKLRFARFQSAITEARADLRSGQTMVDAKPSSLNPDRDLKPMIARGEQIVAESEATIYENQAAMIALLKIVQTQREAQTAIDLTRYNYDLPTATLEEALNTYARALLEECWGRGYETLFFDGVYTSDASGTAPASADIRNQTYDALIKIDGTTFSVTAPVDFRLKADASGNEANPFEYDNASIFKDDKKALLALEIIMPEASSTALLALRAIDLNTQAIASFQLVKISDIVIPDESEELPAWDTIAERIELSDTEQTIDRLTQTQKPYTFDFSAPEGDLITPLLLGYTLANNSNLQLVGSQFIKYVYGDDLETPEAWTGKATASIIAKEGAEEHSFDVFAKSKASDAELPAGNLLLFKPAQPEPTTPEVITETE